MDGGRLAAAVWASPDQVPIISLALNVVIRETKSPAPPTGAPGPFRLSDEKMFANSLKESGFKDVATERISVSFIFDSAEDYTRYVYDTAAPLQAVLANQTPDRSDEVLRAITESAREFAENDTVTVKLTNEAICVVGKK